MSRCHITAKQARQYGLVLRGVKRARKALEPPNFIVLPDCPTEARKGVYTLIIPGFVPVLNNVLIRAHWSRRTRLLKADADIVGHYAKEQGIPLAERKRRVLAKISKPGTPQQQGDVDAYQKSLLDALKACCLIVNDSTAWCETPPWEIVRGPRETVITLEDI